MTAISSSTANQQQLGASILGSLGVGNGLNINSIVSQLVAAEGQPVTSQITSQETAVNTQLSGLGQLQNALTTFQSAVTALQTAGGLQAASASSSNSSIVTATASPGAAAATHSIEVDQLATQQTSITTAQFANSAAVVGTGTLTFTLGSGTAFNVNIDSSNDTLAGIANAINTASGNNSVQAGIINVDNSSGTGTVSELELTSTNPGTANAFTITGSGPSQLLSTNLTNQTTAQDSKIKVDGQTATNSSNNLSNVLPGVTLNLQSASVGTTVDVSVSQNTSSITSALNNFVSAYNSLNSTIQSLQAYGGVGGTNGALFGDPAIQGIEDQIRTTTSNVVNSVSTGYNSLAMIGISIDNTGTMALNTTQLNTALTADPNSVNDVFNNADGVATNLMTGLTNLTGSGGPISTEVSSLNSEITSLQSQQTAENAYLDSYQATLQQEYASMQTLVSQYSSTGSFLTSWINSNSGSSSSSSGK
ncbi:MAG: flagellar filament capping protein FliD [Methylomonas sp.]|jgi:flagellar hook-associated protein 2